MQDDRRFVDFQQAIARLEESLAEPPEWYGEGLEHQKVRVVL